MSPARLFELFSSHWTTAILASGVNLGVFAHIERGARTLPEIARATGMHERPARALLDGLVGIGILTVTNGTFANVPAASSHLIPGKIGYMGAFARIVTGDGDGAMRQWSRLGDALTSGKPVNPETILAPDHPFWPELAVALEPLTVDVARATAIALDLASRASTRVLDIGGGSGAFALAWLPVAPSVHVTQLDWEPMNRVANGQVKRAGHLDRFVTVDGDMRTTDWGDGVYDYVVLSNIVHHESPEGSVELLERARRALAPGGRVLLADFFITSDRTGPAFALRFHAGMVLQTELGAAYTVDDGLAWLAAAGFADPDTVLVHEISTVLAGTRAP